MSPGLGPTVIHASFVAAGVAVAAAVFAVEARRRGTTDERVLYVVTGALVGGALFMRLGTWAQHLDPAENASLAAQWLYGNRSVLGGLVGAWLGVHVTKRLVGYRMRTGDLFAPAVAAGMAVGRVGCLLTERPGTPTAGGWGVHLSPERAAEFGVPAGVGLRRSATRSPSTQSHSRCCGDGRGTSHCRPGRPSCGTWPATGRSGLRWSSCAATRWCGTD